jgi:hypothetical protein
MKACPKLPTAFDTAKDMSQPKLPPQTPFSFEIGFKTIDKNVA